MLLFWYLQFFNGKKNKSKRKEVYVYNDTKRDNRPEFHALSCFYSHRCVENLKKKNENVCVRVQILGWAAELVSLVFAWLRLERRSPAGLGWKEEAEDLGGGGSGPAPLTPKRQVLCVVSSQQASFMPFSQRLKRKKKRLCQAEHCTPSLKKHEQCTETIFICIVHTCHCFVVGFCRKKTTLTRKKQPQSFELVISAFL